VNLLPLINEGGDPTDATIFSGNLLCW